MSLVMAKQTKGTRGETVQLELDDLQRRYRMMELGRKIYSEDNQTAVRMQKQQIEKLKKDNDRLKEELSLETRQARQANNMSASVQIAKLQDQGDGYSRKIEIEKRRIEELDKAIKKMQGTILTQRKEMGGINASRENNQQVQKQIRILENRLDKALVKFNEALAHNKQLRETIDNLRRERAVFDGIYKKLERELQEKKQKMAEIIEISNAAYEARDKAQEEMLALKHQADKEHTNFEVEWSQLGQLIEKDRKMKDYIKTKERERSTARTGDPAVEQEQALKRRVTKGAWGIAKDKANIHLSMEKVQSYEEAFAKIQKATKITDIDELVSTFINAEDHNFSLFNYVNDLSNEIEKLEEQTSSLREEIARYKGQAGAPTDNQRKKILEELEHRLTKTETKATVHEAKYHQATKTINSLKSGIASIFSKIGCDINGSPQQIEMLGTAGVTESNMMQYLGLIEQRTNDLLAQYASLQARVAGGLDGEQGLITNGSSTFGSYDLAATLPAATLSPQPSDQRAASRNESRQGTGAGHESEEDDEEEEETRPADHGGDEDDE